MRYPATKSSYLRKYVRTYLRTYVRTYVCTYVRKDRDPLWSDCRTLIPPSSPQIFKGKLGTDGRRPGIGAVQSLNCTFLKYERKIIEKRLTISEPTKFAQFWVISVIKYIVQKYLISDRFEFLERFCFRVF